MKKKIHFFINLIAVVGIFLCPGIPFASETRVDSAGGITSVLDDETNNGDMFLDGNPAGLVLLKTRDRFDLAGQWTYSNFQPAAQGAIQQSFGTIPRLSNSGVLKYEGLMVFPDPHWAFQVAGDFVNPQGQPAFNYDTYNTQQYRELVRAAYYAGPFALGLEVSNVEADNNYDPGLFNVYVGQSSGSSNENKTRVRAGIITTFPENLEKDSPRWQVGGVFETQLGSDIISLSTERFYLNSPSFSLQQNTSFTQYYLFGPEVRYKIPGRLILRFSSFVTNDYTQFSQNNSTPISAFPNLSPYISSQYQNMNNVGAFRLTLPLSDTENFKFGGSLTAYLYNTDLIGPGGNVFNNQNRQQLNGTFGIGLETPGDRTLGLQFLFQSYNYDVQVVSTGSTMATDYDFYQITLGGEKRLSSQWALRGGLIAEEDIFTQSVNLNSLNASAVMGVGFEDKGIRLDSKFLLGQGVSLDNLSHNVISLGAEIQGTLFL